ncbi:hypothetical protein F2P81_007435 [Scophthalmus maximus]|uniref:ABM domain-containing protein n=1 Tax=Scophthalmus maximus TaxID=52904 RepID=A0A6A4T5J7_SCOMX|nr:hypothetical protein F2P81_007435 [Scophthalmus maximus]
MVVSALTVFWLCVFYWEVLDAAAAVKGRLDVKVTLQGNEEMRRSEGVDKDELGKLRGTDRPLSVCSYRSAVYERGTNVEQFVTRFLLKESANQIQSLLSSVESAVDAIDEQHSQSGHLPAKNYPIDEERQVRKNLLHLVIHIFYCVFYTENYLLFARHRLVLSGIHVPKERRERYIQMTLRSSIERSAVEVRKEGLEAQINRLAELIGRLENKRSAKVSVRATSSTATHRSDSCRKPAALTSVWLDLHQRLTDTDGTTSASLWLIRQEMVVSQKKLGEFCEALKQYLKNVSAQRDCFHVTAVRLPDGLSFVVYEFWDGEEEWKRHLQSAPNKAFQHVKVDTLCQPETVSSVAVPVCGSKAANKCSNTPTKTKGRPASQLLVVFSLAASERTWMNMDEHGCVCGK